MLRNPYTGRQYSAPNVIAFTWLPSPRLMTDDQLCRVVHVDVACTEVATVLSRAHLHYTTSQPQNEFIVKAA